MRSGRASLVPTRFLLTPQFFRLLNLQQSVIKTLKEIILSARLVGLPDK
jgi:hypothetical protein